MHELGERAQITRRFDPDGRQLDYIASECAQLFAQDAGLRPGAGHDDPLTGKRPIFKPAQFISQCDHVSENGDGRRGESGLGDALRNTFEIADQRFLPAGGRPSNQCHRQIASHSVRQHFARDRFDSLDAHQHHLRASEFGERRKVDRDLGFLRIFVPGKKGDVRILSAVRHRNPGVGRSGNRRRNSGNYDERHARRSKRLRFFRAAPEHKRIPAL